MIGVAAGVLQFSVLIAVGLAVGWGLLGVLRFPADPLRRLLLAPFAATVLWALAGNLLLRSGLTLAQAAPGIGVASLGLAVFGLAQAVRTGIRPGPGVLVAGCGLVAGLVTWPYFARGLTVHLGSHNLDTTYYTSVAAVLWRYGFDTSLATQPFFERFGAIAAAMAESRNHTFVLLGLLSPLVQPGEPVFVRNVFVCWSLFVLACNLGFYALSWTGPPGGSGRPCRVPLIYVAVTLGLGWAGIPALVGNWDNGLLVSVGPVLAGLAADPVPGTAWAILLGTTVAYAVFTYPELAPLLGLFLLPFYLGRPALRLGRAPVIAVALAGALLLPGAGALWRFLWSQVAAARVREGVRPGGGFAGMLVATPLDPAAWWALGTQNRRLSELSDAALSGLFACGLLLSALALTGVIRLARHGGWREVASLGLVGASLVYFLRVERYGYAGYKILSVMWWLVGRCLVEGCRAVLAPPRARPNAWATGRVGRGLTVGAIAGILVAGGLVAAGQRFHAYFSPVVFQRQPTPAALDRLRSAAAGQPPMDVLVDSPLHDQITLSWILYALKDTPIRMYHARQLAAGIPGEAAWPPGRSAPDAVLLRSEDLRAAEVLFQTPEFALVSLETIPFVERVDSPNELETWGTWLGTSPITISLLARPGMSAVLSFDASPGPSLPETRRRVILLHAGSRQLGRVEIDGPITVAFPFRTSGGRERLVLSTPDTPSVPVLPNGDRRPLLVQIRALRVDPAPGSRRRGARRCLVVG